MWLIVPVCILRENIKKQPNFKSRLLHMSLIWPLVNIKRTKFKVTNHTSWGNNNTLSRHAVNCSRQLISNDNTEKSREILNGRLGTSIFFYYFLLKAPWWWDHLSATYIPQFGHNLDHATTQRNDLFTCWYAEQSNFYCPENNI